jgi:hypothetical protein
MNWPSSQEVHRLCGAAPSIPVAALRLFSQQCRPEIPRLPRGVPSARRCSARR